MSPTQARGGSGNAEGYLIGGLALLAVGAVLDLWAGAHLAAVFDGAPRPTGSPLRLLTNLAHHTYRWSGAATGWSIGVAAAVLLLAAALTAAVYKRRFGGAGIDHAAQHAPRDRGVRRYVAGATRGPGVFTGPGPTIGVLKGGGRPQLRASWEDMLVAIAGPRTGKTTSLAIPAILDAPGAVLVTSNKRDIVDATRGIRGEVGRCWIFDPQNVAGAGAGWWWNPVSYVADVRSARKLAAVWTNASKEPGARTDAYFDNAGQELLAQLLLAAAAGGRPISAVFSWLTDPDENEPIGLLRRGGHSLSADGLRATLDLPAKQKAGVYGTASKTVSFLSDPQVLAWVENPDPAAQEGQAEFSPAAFAASTDTLYSLSREGEGSSGPLVTALTAAVLEAAERLAASSTGGRLAVPLLAVLDEVANVCRWRELPDLYSHYGSRGIVVLSILQSWAQGVTCWGEQGMQKLWDASNVKIYGGGTTDTRFLEALSQLFGHYDRQTRSRSQSAQGASTSWSSQRERVLPVDELAALPPGRAAVALSGTRPVLVETIPWMARKDAAAVTASLERYATPSGHRAATLDGRAPQVGSGA